MTEHERGGIGLECRIHESSVCHPGAPGCTPDTEGTEFCDPQIFTDWHRFFGTTVTTTIFAAHGSRINTFTALAVIAVLVGRFSHAVWNLCSSPDIASVFTDESPFERDMGLIIPALEVLKGLAGRYNPKQWKSRAIVSGAMALHAVAWHKSGNAKAAVYKGRNRRLPADGALAGDWLQPVVEECNLFGGSGVSETPIRVRFIQLYPGKFLYP